MTENLAASQLEDLRHIPRSALVDLLWRTLGLQSHPEHTDVIIGVAAVRVLRNNPNRIAWTIINHSSTSIFLGFTAEITIGSGFYLAPNGSSIQFKVRDDAAMVIDEIYAISAGAGLTVSAIETIIDDVKRG